MALFLKGGDPKWPSPPPASASLHWLHWQADRWLGWVASGLCALSVIKGRKKVYGLLVSDLPTDGMSSKHPPISDLSRGLVGVGGRRSVLFRKQPVHQIRWFCAHLDNLGVNQVKWVKLKWSLNIYALILIAVGAQQLSVVTAAIFHSQDSRLAEASSRRVLKTNAD